MITFGNRLPDPRMANDCIRDGVFDFWEVCRPLLADPELIHKAAEDRLDEVRRCVGSLNCLSRLFRDLPYTCTMNPALGHEVEPEYHVTPTTVKKKIMVIGSGPAGMECAITAAKRGHEVTVFEKTGRIGGNLYAYAANDLARPDDLHSISALKRSRSGSGLVGSTPRSLQSSCAASCISTTFASSRLRNYRPQPIAVEGQS